MFSAVQTSMPAAMQFLDILVALGMAAARRVGMGQFIDDDDARLAGQRRVEIEFLDGRPWYSTCRRGSTSRPSSSAAVSPRPWVSTRPTTISTPSAFRRRARASMA